MKYMQSWLAVTALLGLVFAGCNNDAAEPPKKSNETVKESKAKDDHGHHHGPKGGELFVFEEAGFTGEWVPKYGQNLIQFYIYDTDQKTEKKINAAKLVATFKAGEEKKFDIPAVAADAEGMSSRFETEDEQLALAMKSNGVDLEVEIDGTTHKVFLPKDPHSH